MNYGVASFLAMLVFELCPGRLSVGRDHAGVWPRPTRPQVGVGMVQHTSMSRDLTLPIAGGTLPPAEGEQVELGWRRKSIAGNAWHFSATRFLFDDGVGFQWCGTSRGATADKKGRITLAEHMDFEST